MAARAKRTEAITGNTISVNEDPMQLDEAAVVEAAAEVLSTALDDDLGEPDEGEQAEEPVQVDEASAGSVDVVTGELVGQHALPLELPPPNWEALGKAFAKVEEAAAQLLWAKAHAKRLKETYEEAIADLRALGRHVPQRQVAAAASVVVEADRAGESQGDDEAPPVAEEDEQADEDDQADDDQFAREWAEADAADENSEPDQL